VLLCDDVRVSGNKRTITKTGTAVRLQDRNLGEGTGPSAGSYKGTVKKRKGKTKVNCPATQHNTSLHGSGYLTALYQEAIEGVTKKAWLAAAAVEGG